MAEPLTPAVGDWIFHLSIGGNNVPNVNLVRALCPAENGPKHHPRPAGVMVAPDRRRRPDFLPLENIVLIGPDQAACELARHRYCHSYATEAAARVQIEQEREALNRRAADLSRMTIAAAIAAARARD